MEVTENVNVKYAKVTVICCLHGDEVFGKKVFDYYQKRISNLLGVRVVFANEQAFKKGVRFVNSDLNRSFPGKTNGNHEEGVAFEILKLIKNDEYVIDIHTTTTDIRVAPIVTNLGLKKRRVLNLSSSREIVLMDKNQAKHSLIGNVRTGVSFEFGKKFALTREALEEVTSIVDCLLNGSKHKIIPRRVFHITGKVSLGFPLPENAKNFQKIDSLGYPFLLGEKSYKNHQGFFAEKFVVEKI